MTGFFVGFAMFFPRLTLFVCYLASVMPPNPTDLAVDVVGFLLAPRLLIAYWLYTDPAWGGGWAALFVVLAFLSGSSFVKGSRAARLAKEPS